MRGNMEELNDKTQIWASALSNYVTLEKLLKGSQIPDRLLYDTGTLFILEGPYEN